MNTGYDPTYTAIDGIHSTQACANASATIAGTQSQQAAWAVGCSEAQRDVSYASAQSALAPTAWWLDVETANSWSTSDLTLNTYAIKGIVATLRQSTSVPIGVYSTSAQWTAITGGYQAPVDANWVATGQRSVKRAKQSCSSSGFTGAKVSWSQYGRQLRPRPRLLTRSSKTPTGPTPPRASTDSDRLPEPRSHRTPAIAAGGRRLEKAPV